MARIRLTPPESYAFRTRIQVRITDLNYGGHMGNNVLLELLHEARVQFFKSLGYTEKKFGNAGIIMADAAVQYRSEAFAGDTLEIAIQPFDFSIAGFDLFYEVRCVDDDRLVALAKTFMVCYDYENKKTADVPEDFKKKFGS